MYFSENGEAFVPFSSLSGSNFPPTEERAGPEGAEEEPPRVLLPSTTASSIPTNNSGNIQERNDEEDAEDDEGEEQCKYTLKNIRKKRKRSE